MTAPSTAATRPNCQRTSCGSSTSNHGPALPRARPRGRDLTEPEARDEETRPGFRAPLPPRQAVRRGLGGVREALVRRLPQTSSRRTGCRSPRRLAASNTSGRCLGCAGRCRSSPVGRRRGLEHVVVLHPKGRKRWSGPGNLTHLAHLALRGEGKHKAEKPLDQALDLVSFFSARRKRLRPVRG